MYVCLCVCMYVCMYDPYCLLGGGRGLIVTYIFGHMLPQKFNIFEVTSIIVTYIFEALSRIFFI